MPGTENEETETPFKAATPDFFAGPTETAPRTTFSDSEILPEELLNSEASAESASKTSSFSKEFSGATSNRIDLSFPKFLIQYLAIAQRLLLSPIKFLSHIERDTDLSEPSKFLALSASATGLLSFVLGGFNFGLILRNSFFVALSCFIVSGLVFMMAKSMGSKTNFATVFRIFAYCSCLSVLATLPGVGFLALLAAPAIMFLGMKELLNVSLYQTCSIMFLVCFLQVIMGLGQMLGH